MNDECEFLIVGLGLAGGILAWELHSRGRSVVVIDDCREDAASRVAAGLINPVTGKRFAKSWEFERFFPQAETTYRELEKLFGEVFLVRKPLHRVFRDADERRHFERRQDAPEVAPFVDSLINPGICPGQVNDPAGSVCLRNTGFCRTRALTDRLASWLEDQGRLRREAFDSGALQMTEDGLAYGQLRARRVVFCEGARGAHNSWFRWVPWNLAKGEILSLEPREPTPLPDSILNGGKWLIPVGDGRFRAGATYSWDDLEAEPTAEGREEILAGVRQFVRAPFRVVRHEAGVRPVAHDRRPLLGIHPQEPRIAMFNGLGSKGSVLAPAHAAMLADFLCDEGDLEPASNILRFWQRR